MRMTVTQLGSAMLTLMVLAACGEKDQLGDADRGGTSQVKPSNPDPSNPVTPGSNPNPSPGTDPNPNPDPDPGQEVVPSELVADLRVDVNRDGLVDVTGTTDEEGESEWTHARGAIFLANIDDDTERCRATSASLDDRQLPLCNDAQDEGVNGPDDAFDLAPVRVVAWPEAPDAALGKMSVSTAGAAKIRLFRKLGSTFKVFNPSVDTLSAPELREGVELAIEGKDVIRDNQWDGSVDLTLTVAVSDTEVQTDTVRLRIAPVLLTHHLLRGVRTFVSKLSFNSTFIQHMQTALQKTTVPDFVGITTNDPWTQDFFETGYMTMPSARGQQVIRVNVRAPSLWGRPASVNGYASSLRAAGRVVFTQWRGKDVGGVQPFDFSVRLTRPRLEADSLNSTGNLETIPPYSTTTASFPRGRILMGNYNGFGPDPTFIKFLEAQGAQKPVYVDTSWLLVGHVDETISFVKASTPRGWKLLINDARAARKILEQLSMQGRGATKLFVGKSLGDENGAEFSVEQTVDQLLANGPVMDANDAAAAKIDQQLAILKAELGLADSEIIRVPFLHHDFAGFSVAYSPGIVNGLLVDDTNFIAPDPFGPVVNGVDLFRVDLQSQLQALGITTHWVDDWYTYHANLGEIHCGTNVVREIPSNPGWGNGR